ncbi:MAG TPA: phosphate ABC transporter permease subunit PstC [Edaphocola sp.]|nr:phosphate ABC transporter permease subunit PstC [Edaphocola sp.]
MTNNKTQVSFKNSYRSDRIFQVTLSTAAYLLLVLLVGILITLVLGSIPTIKSHGFNFAFDKVWNPIMEEFGALPFIIGTLLTSLIALAISFPVSMSISLFLGEYFKKGSISSLFSNILELLAGIPSVIYGFTALFFIVPIIRWIEIKLGIPAIGLGIMTASIVLAVMIIPYAASIAREVLKLTPNDLKEGGYALGATRYELIRYITFPQARSGIMAGTLLAFGRALGETMAVTMVIGNANVIPKNIFDPANTMASIIANEFSEASSDLHMAALIEIGLLLFLITAFFNIIGKLYIKRLAKK